MPRCQTLSTPPGWISALQARLINLDPAPVALAADGDGERAVAIGAVGDVSDWPERRVQRQDAEVGVACSRVTGAHLDGGGAAVAVSEPVETSWKVASAMPRAR